MKKGKRHRWPNEWRAAWQPGVAGKPLLGNWNSFPTQTRPIRPPGSLACSRSQPQVVRALWIIFPNASPSASAGLRLHSAGAAASSGCERLLPDTHCFFHLSSRPPLPHLHKMNNQHFEEPFFFAPKMSLLRVYFSWPIKQMLPSLRGVFGASQSLSLAGTPAAPGSAQPLRVPGRWAGLPRKQGSKSKCCPACWGGGRLLLANGGVQTSTEQMQTGSNCCGSSLVPWKRASRLEQDGPGLKSQTCHLQSASWTGCFVF